MAQDEKKATNERSIALLVDGPRQGEEVRSLLSEFLAVAVLPTKADSTQVAPHDGKVMKIGSLPHCVPGKAGV